MWRSYFCDEHYQHQWGELTLNALPAEKQNVVELCYLKEIEQKVVLARMEELREHGGNIQEICELEKTLIYCEAWLERLRNPIDLGNGFRFVSG